MEVLLYIILLLTLVNIFFFILWRNKPGEENRQLADNMNDLNRSLARIEAGLKEDFRINREENANIAKENRSELNNTLKELKLELGETLKTLSETNVNSLDRINKQVQEKLRELTEQAKTDNKEMRESLEKVFRSFQETFDKNVESFNNLQREKFGQLEQKQTILVESTEKKLEQMRVTVDEKLQKTLNERLGQSFETVSKQLLAVQEGLGEMKNLAQDVGGLKKVLSNVKMRGGIGEVQLSMLLEQVLAPEQYEANVRTKKGSTETVEFAIKLPGKEDHQETVYLPVDAKFPREAYEKLVDAYEGADLIQIETAGKNMENVIKKMAKDIHDKYIDPPNTTDFGIMFLPFEGIYAEIVRRASLLEQLQRDYKVIVTGPTTLAAILNSLQMGFRTLAIQKRSSEVWKILGAVKKEFENFGGMLEKAQKNIHTASNQIDEVMGKRTRAIQRKLKSVETLSDPETKLILPELADKDLPEEDNDDE